jgi:hypothetical protein
MDAQLTNSNLNGTERRSLGAANGMRGVCRERLVPQFLESAARRARCPFLKAAGLASKDRDIRSLLVYDRRKMLRQ